MLGPFWQKLFKFKWVFGVVMILLLGVPRFILVLNANVSGNYSLVSIVFLLMWISPFIFLTSKGRKEIGMKRPANYYWLIYSFLIGIAICALIFVVASSLFDHTLNNFFVYLAKSYAVSGTSLTQSDRLIYFAIYALIGMTFSPIGEELFYRGIIHESFVPDIGENRASVIDSLAFAFTHLAHFGIVYISGKWQFLFIPALLWVFSMYLTSRLFFMCKQKTGSITGAIFSHAGFNLAMMYFIFYHIL